MQLLRITVGDLLDLVTSRFPGNEFLVDLAKGRRYTYSEFRAVVNRLAKALIGLGLEKGEHFALWAHNGHEWIITEFALAKIGVVLVSVDAKAQAENAQYILKQSDSGTLAVAEGLPDRPLNWDDLPGLKRLIVIGDRKQPGALRWEELLELGREVSDQRLSERQRSCDPEDIATILYTSGTTGAPKGVMSTHFGMINTTLASADNQRLTERDRLCLSVPLSHMFGCICVNPAALAKGATIIIPPGGASPAETLEAIKLEKCTAIYGSPNGFLALMGDPVYRSGDVRSLRTGIMGGAQCPMEVMKRVVHELGAKEIVIGYGQTEASSWITQTLPDDPLELRVSTVGRSLPNVEVKIIDPGSGQEVQRGVVGEICARGFIMKGYYKMPAATANAIDSEGWLHTGDLGTMDEGGYVRTTGRLKDVIRRGDETIYPTEVEEVLFSHPKVVNAQVFAVPDKGLGEEVAAWIKLGEGATITRDEILLHCSQRLPKAHLPKYIKFVSEFPMTPLGKVQKFRMREIAIEEYGLGE
jgi:fatty-acyl-CoA synthase